MGNFCFFFLHEEEMSDKIPLLKPGIAKAKQWQDVLKGLGITAGVLLLVAAFVIAVLALVLRGQAIDGLNRDLEILSNETVDLIERTNALEDAAGNATQQIGDLEQRVETLENNTEIFTQLFETLLLPPPIHGLVGFWWADSLNLRLDWARFNDTTGAMLGPHIPYSTTEYRVSSGPPGKVQYARGPGPSQLIYLVWAGTSFVRYLVRHDTAAETFLKTDLGPDPVGHDNPEMTAYDRGNGRYIAMAAVTAQSNKYGVVVIDENTGAVTELSGAAGTLPPAPVNVALAVDVIGDKILFFDRYDDNPANLGHIIFYNSSDGQYLSESFFQGTFIPAPGTFLPTFLTIPLTRMFYLGVGYDEANSRLHVLFSTISGPADRVFAYIQGTSEADLLSKLQSGNYDLHLAKFMPAPLLNTITYIEPPSFARRRRSHHQ